MTAGVVFASVVAMLALGAFLIRRRQGSRPPRQPASRNGSEPIPDPVRRVRSSARRDQLTCTALLEDGTQDPGWADHAACAPDVVVLESTLTCPSCGVEATETMPEDACQYFYECSACGTRLRPRAGDCCVFCSYGTVACPPQQADGRLDAGSCCDDTQPDRVIATRCAIQLRRTVATSAWATTTAVGRRPRPWRGPARRAPGRAARPPLRTAASASNGSAAAAPRGAPGSDEAPP